MNRFVLWGVALLMISGSLSSCSFHRKVTRKKAQSFDSTAVSYSTDTNHQAITFQHVVLPELDTEASVAAVKDTSVARRKLIADLTPVWKKRISFKTFSAKAKVHFESPDDKQEFTANIRLKKDSLIWINVSAFGITAARILITPDSIFMLMQLKKEFRKLALKEAAKILPAKIDFASLQHLLLGEPLREGTIEDATSFGGTWALQVEDSSYVQRITYNKEDSTMRTSQLRTRNPSGPQTMSEYGSYETINNRKISTQRVVNIQNGADTYMLDLNFQKMDFDEQLEYPFSIPNSYSEAK